MRRPGPARDRHDGHVHGLGLVLVSLPVAGEGRRAVRSGARRAVDAGRPVHGRLGARGDAPALRARVHEDDARRRSHRSGRAVPAPVQPGTDPGHGRRADVQVTRQHRRPGRPGGEVRRGHGPAVPHVHGPVGPGWAMEPDRDRRRPPVPEPHLDDRLGSARPRARRSGIRLAAGGRGRGGGSNGGPPGRPPHAPRCHGRLRSLPLQHHDRQAHGAGEPADALSRDGRRRVAGVGRGGPAGVADAGARGPAHHRGAVVPAAGRRR